MRQESQQIPLKACPLERISALGQSIAVSIPYKIAVGLYAGLDVRREILAEVSVHLL